MRLKLIACKALFREISYACAMSDNAVDVTWLRQGYHNEPEKLRAWIQKEIDLVESGEDPHTVATGAGEDTSVSDDFDAIILGYGLCSNATASLTTKRLPLVIPRAHDCITLILGSKERYNKVFHEIPGCYWYTASWIENTTMPGQARHDQLVKKYEDMGYDEETIEYLLTELGGLNNYHNAMYISTPFIDNTRYRAITQKAAEFYGWQYHEEEGNLSLMTRLIGGDWSDEDFLVLQPGETAVQTGQKNVITRAPYQGA